MNWKGKQLVYKEIFEDCCNNILCIYVKNVSYLNGTHAQVILEYIASRGSGLSESNVVKEKIPNFDFSGHKNIEYFSNFLVFHNSF